MKRIQELFLMDPDMISKQIDPYFNKYFKGYIGLDGSQKFLKICEFYTKLIKPKNKLIVDVGCGFGIIDIYLALRGAKIVYGIDLEKNLAFNRINKLLKVDNVIPIKGYADNLPVSTSSIDIVLITDAISHINNITGFFKEAYRVLKPNSILFIEDGSGLNKRLLRHLEPARSSVHNKYRDKRKQMIKEDFPNLSNKLLEYLTDMTKGLWGLEIRDAVGTYLKTGKIKCQEKDDIREPDTGYWMEKMWDPYHIKKLLQEYGFRTIKITANDHRLLYETGKRGVKGNLRNIVSKLPTPLGLRILPKFEIIAVK
jgi:ubiquinone/menaquinone biosynthesis C-methylase UbiE